MSEKEFGKIVKVDRGCLRAEQLHVGAHTVNVSCIKHLQDALN